MADSTNDLVSKNDAIAYLGVDPTETEDAAIIEELITAVSIWCNTYTGRDLLSREHTEYYDGTGDDELYVRNYPITTLTSVHIDSDREYNDDDLIDAGDLVTYDNAGLIVYVDGDFGTGRQSVQVVYTAGYALADVPHDLKVAALDQIKFMYKRWRNDEEGLSSISVQNGTVNIEIQDLTKHFQRVIEKYVRRGHLGSRYGT